MPAEHPSVSSFSLVVAQALSWRTPLNEVVFADASLSLGRERVGLVGPNGVGKSTLLRILAGSLAPQSGNVAREGSIEILPQTIDDARVAGRSVAELLGVARKLDALDRLHNGGGTDADLLALDDDWTIDVRARSQLDAVGLPQVDLRAPVDRLSGGEITRVLLAGMLLRAPDVLLLDEPTNNLDRVARASLYRVIETWRAGMIVVTHDRELLGRVDRILEMSAKLGLRSYGGNWTVYDERKRIEHDAALAEFDNAAKELKVARRHAQRVRERQNRRASHGKKRAESSGIPKIILGGMKRKAEATSARLADRQAELIDDARDRKRAAQDRLDDRSTLDIDLARVELPAGKMVVRAEDASFRFPGSDRPLLDRLSFELTGPQRLAITGPNGCGKTTLLRLIVGELQPTDGMIRRGVARFAYLDQHASAVLPPGVSLLDTVRRANPAWSETTARQTLARFLFERDDVHRLPETLSGGQRLRAALAAALSAIQPPQLLLLDEPTNHLDLESLTNLESALRGYTGAVVVVSHDATFLARVGCSHTLELPVGLVQKYDS